MTPEQQLDSEEFAFWRFDDLLERRIVTNRQDLSNKQKLYGFPRPVKLGGAGRHGVALFPRRAVEAWIRQRLTRSAG